MHTFETVFSLTMTDSCLSLIIDQLLYLYDKVYDYHSYDRTEMPATGNTIVKLQVAIIVCVMVPTTRKAMPEG